MWELDYKESWALKNWCFWTVVLEKSLESPWTATRCNQSILKEISPAYSLEDWYWSWNSNTLATWYEEQTHLKDPDAGKDWSCGEKGMTKDEMVSWHRRLNGHGFGWTLGAGDGQGGLACCDSWGRKESDTTERLIWSDLTCLVKAIVFPVVMYGCES